MVPNQAPPISATITEPLPPLTRSTTLPAYTPRTIATDRSHLAPEDAIYHGSPPRRQSEAVNGLQNELRMTNAPNGDAARLPRRHRDRNRSGSRRPRKGTWKKLLWVKQSCKYKSFDLMGNYADELQTQIIIPIKIPSSNICSGIHVSNHTTSGLW
jgi:phosphatidylinositol glycan class C protein